MLAKNDRLGRLNRLLDLRKRVDDDIAALEDEIRSEMAAMARAKVAARNAEVRLHRRREALCGTDGGYYRHRRKHKQPACDACKLAHRVAEAERKRRREVAA